MIHLKSNLAKILLAFALLLPAASSASAQDEKGKTKLNVKVGFLKCSVGSGWGLLFGSVRTVGCIFSGDGGTHVERYYGRINTFGIDIGYRKHGVMLWTVWTAAAGHKPGVLAGTYAGISMDAAVGYGVGGKFLLGGFKKSYALRPASIEGIKGLNVAAGISSLTLKSAD